MSTASTSILDRFLDPVAECLTPEVAKRIVNLKLDPTLQSRLNDLAVKANDGRLTPEEQGEYEECVEGVDLLGILKAKARLSLCRRIS